MLVLTESTFNEFPDLQLTDMSFRELRKVSDANPQKAQFLWGTAELVHFRNADGVPLNATLYKPENFDPKKKYPMIVYIYERLSQNVHTFVEPRPEPQHQPDLLCQQRVSGAGAGYRVYDRISGTERAEVRASGGAGGGGRGIRERECDRHPGT